MKIADIEQLDRVLLGRLLPAKDHPLLASRLRQITKQKAQVNVLHSVDDDC